MKALLYIDVGLKTYKTVWKMQERLRAARRDGRVGDLVIFCEHPPVYTMGKKDCSDDLISSPAEIERDGIETIKCNRGGRITYHGPGQLIVYFIVEVRNYASGVKEFVSKIEDACIDYLSGLGLTPSRKSKYPGIWLGDKKIAAIGLHVSNGISIHGMAINVTTDLSHYRHIIPCGIKGHGITSLANELNGRALSMDEVRDGLIDSIGKSFTLRRR